MATWVWILIAIAVVAVIVLVAMAARQRRAAALRERFGPEYDRAVEARDGQRAAAEADLREREKQHARLEIRPLPEDARFAHEWQGLQERFVDEPADAVVEADRLVNIVMDARGYPMGDFDTQADLVSVDHPQVVENYRVAHGIHGRAQARQASTEDLREALLRYRSLFDELLRASDDEAGAPGRHRRDGVTGRGNADGDGRDPRVSAEVPGPGTRSSAEGEVDDERP